MDVTDADIKLAKVSAMVNNAIQDCQKTLGEIAQYEAELRVKKAKFEHWLGELIAKKLMLDQQRRI